MGPLPRWVPRRLLGEPLGLLSLGCTTPVGVEHKDLSGEVLGQKAVHVLYHVKNS
jgi:hypothetical protein